METRYAIQTRIGEGAWQGQESVACDATGAEPFETYGAAETAVATLRAMGHEWAACEYRIVETDGAR